MSLFDEKMKDPKFRKYFCRESFYFDISEEIAEAMKDSGIDKFTLAKKVMISKRKMKRILCGASNVKLKTIADIFHALDKRVTVKTSPIMKGPQS